jgi:hypothetical protein
LQAEKSKLTGATLLHGKENTWSVLHLGETSRDIGDEGRLDTTNSKSVPPGVGQIEGHTYAILRLAALEGLLDSFHGSGRVSMKSIEVMIKSG